MELTSYDRVPIGTTIRAPGKLVLAGEYAVVDGGCSIVLAINRGVECEVTTDLGITTPNGDTRFVNHAVERIPYGLRFRDWNPVLSLNDQKPGFGGSAAACVIATVLSGRRIEEAIKIHREIQGSGSGIDVMASIYGGVFHWDPIKEIRTPLQEISPIVVWTGNSARTGERVETYLQYDKRQPFIDQSNLFTELFVREPISATSSLYKNLKKLSYDAGFQYTTPAIEEIVQLAQHHNGAAKPSGAGGGDCMIAFFKNTHDSEEFSTAIDNHSIYQRIDVEISSGVHVVPTP